MKRQIRSISIAETAYSQDETTSKCVSRLPSMTFDSFTSSPKAKKISKRNKTSRCFTKAKILAPIEVLEFKSPHRRKKFKLDVFLETQKLKMNKKLAQKLLETPEADFDCQSDDDLITSTIKTKSAELKKALNKLKRVSR